jgi:type II secretory pathway pseudopilin PulG
LDIQTISIVIAAAGVFIAAINSVYSSREARQQRQTEIETRQAELFMNVYNRWNTTELQAAYGLARFDIAS